MNFMTLLKSRDYIEKAKNRVKIFQVVVAWLESIEDAENFPLGDLVASVNNICLVIFVHPLASGLHRIKLAGQIGK